LFAAEKDEAEDEDNQTLPKLTENDAVAGEVAKPETGEVPVVISLFIADCRA
jgi:hypothetical protein